MRRRESFPKPGDRVRLAVPPPAGADAKERSGTVLERSCGKSGALRVRWDAEGGRPSREGWLADATWYWSHAYLRVAPSAGKDAAAPIVTAAPEPAEDDVAWAPRSARAGAGRGTRGAITTGSLAAAAEWEAALAAETAPAADESWEDVLAAALGLGPAPSGPPAARKAPAHAAASPAAAKRRPASPATAPASEPPAPPRKATPPEPQPRPAPAPPRPSVPPPPEARRSDDILPGRGGRRGRKRD